MYVSPAVHNCKHKTIIVSWSTINSSTSAYCLRFQQKKCNFQKGKTVEKIVKLFTVVRRGVAPTAPAKEILLMMTSVTELVLTMNSVHLLNQLSHLPRLREKIPRAQREIILVVLILAPVVPIVPRRDWVRYRFQYKCTYLCMYVCASQTTSC